MPQSFPDLFEPVPLLEKRLGKERFDELPSSPGIYRFYDNAGELLYVGKSKNLRKRLFTYKRAMPGKVSRKVSRLISQIARFDIEEAETERDALLLENRLIRYHRPPFNHANKQTEAYYHIYFEPHQSHVEFRLSMAIHEETNRNRWYGAFKGHAPVRRSLGSLLQLLWMAEHNVSSPFCLPVQLTRRLTPVRYSMNFQESSPARQWRAGDMIHQYFLGESCKILDFLAIRIEGGSQLTPFQTRFLEDRLFHLKSFYDYKLQPYRTMRGTRRLIDRNELDDLAVIKRF